MSIATNGTAVTAVSTATWKGKRRELTWYPYPFWEQTPRPTASANQTSRVS